MNQPSVIISLEQLQKIHRDLDACQKVIWLRGGFDPAYCTHAQERLQEIEALMAQADPHTAGRSEFMNYVLSGDIEKLKTSNDALTAELGLIASMCDAIKEGEWADSFAQGETSSKVEAAFNRLVGEVEAANQALYQAQEAALSTGSEAERLKHELMRIKNRRRHDESAITAMQRQLEEALPAEPLKWLAIETAPKDGTLVRLLVEFTDHQIEDTNQPHETIGFNSLENTGFDVWDLAGWNWEMDCFCAGSGKPIGWLPMGSSIKTGVQSDHDAARSPDNE